MSNPVHIEIYSRPGCHLCDEAKTVVESVRRRFPFSLKVINVESDPKLEGLYGAEVPVVAVNGRKAFKYRVDEAELERKVKELWNK